MLYNKVKSTIEKYNMLMEGSYALLAVSGGIDSSVMTHIISQICREKGLRPVLCHLNHSLRGSESDRDEFFVVSLAKEEPGCISETKKINMNEIIDNSKEGSLQSLSRKMRISFFKEIAEKYGVHSIFMAHNLDDLCETFLLRLIRGSGTCGLSSMSFVSRYEGLKIFRPLLDISRDEIVEFSKANKIEFVEDSSNLKSSYDRNKMRNTIIPLLKKEFNPNLSMTIKMVTDLLKEDEDILENLTIRKMEKIVTNKIQGGASLRLDLFSREHLSIQTRILRNVIREIKGNLYDISYINIMDIIHISKSREKKKVLSLPGGIKVEKLNKMLIFSLNFRD